VGWGLVTFSCSDLDGVTREGLHGSVVLQGFVVLPSRGVSVIPKQPKEMHGLGFGLQGRTGGCTCTVRSRGVLKEGAAVYDECEQAHLREVKLPRVRLTSWVSMLDMMMVYSALSRNGWLSGARVERELERVQLSN